MNPSRRSAFKKKKFTRSSRLDSFRRSAFKKKKFTRSSRLDSLSKRMDRLIQRTKDLMIRFERNDQYMQSIYSLYYSVKKEMDDRKMLDGQRVSGLTGTVSLGGPDNLPLNSQVSGVPCTINQQQGSNPSPMLAQQFEQLQTQPASAAVVPPIAATADHNAATTSTTDV